ncbi:Hypothetical protein PHPALM_633 [Phytophthora palmivora]|uniref:DDE-1 domain-containing protein n=1 Tax=Phytophthora palmivora TaxID=4796 RepID=A0A2P4YUD1_9STRA|nr:Hypothetical protein PHPALM_633 [Phytophthora palmivora]
MIFMNAEGKHPIRGVKDNVPGVCYGTKPRGRKKTVFLDNCSGHLEADEYHEEFDAINSDLKFFPPNATDLCQPADSFVNAKIKDAWKMKWN